MSKYRMSNKGADKPRCAVTSTLGGSGGDSGIIQLQSARGYIPNRTERRAAERLRRKEAKRVR